MHIYRDKSNAKVANMGVDVVGICGMHSETMWRVQTEDRISGAEFSGLYWEFHSNTRRILWNSEWEHHIYVQASNHLNGHTSWWSTYTNWSWWWLIKIGARSGVKHSFTLPRGKPLPGNPTNTIDIRLCDIYGWMCRHVLNNDNMWNVNLWVYICGNAPFNKLTAPHTHTHTNVALTPSGHVAE